MFTKEDYMKLDKERLAELLVERDTEDKNRQPFVFPEFPATPPVNPVKYPDGTPLCPYGGACTNPFRDCVNCPGVISTGGRNYQWQTDTKTTTGTTFSTSVNDNGNFNSSTTIQPNKYGTITPTSQEEDSDNDTYEKGYENGWADCLEQAKGNVKDWIYNKGFQDGVKQAEEKMEKRLEEEWEKGNDVGYEDGGDDMLMQMPHWKKVDEDSILGEGTRGCINGNIYCDGWWVSLDELEKKLPRDEGTIYCDSVHIDYVNEEDGIEEDESIAEGCDEWNKFFNKYKNKKK